MESYLQLWACRRGRDYFAATQGYLGRHGKPVAF
jgi:hypothetical protein